MQENSALRFRVSSALKNIIGRDLIVDKYIAVFELVKNCYDADSTEVNIDFRFDSFDTLSISDDGHGMSIDDIKNKWLFVAYSEKSKAHRNNADYRSKRHNAGAKGVGRFSCDRLGRKLILYTKKKDDDNAIKLEINWEDFEVNDLKEFWEITVDYGYVESLPNNKQSGTVLVISELREEWDRNDLLQLKRSLMKLVNPAMEDQSDKFDIYLSAEREIPSDKNQSRDRDKVNGIIKNDVFEKLNLKTTNLNVSISSDGREITTSLSDRGEHVFEIVETNSSYSSLHSLNISVFYLNRAAKYNFKISTGVDTVNYGSIFIYKNGFRIYPYGDPRIDSFGIDARKAQGYNRRLGTREIMGRIQIYGDNDSFIETTSRDGGFIENDDVIQLYDFFMEKALKVLERYVVNIVNWAEPAKDTGATLFPKDVIDKVILEFAGANKRSDIVSIKYNPNIMKYIDEVKRGSVVGAIAEIETIAKKTNNSSLIDLTARVRKDTEKLLKQKGELESENANQYTLIQQAQAERKIREKQIYFLKSATKKDAEFLLEGMHLIYTQSESILTTIEDISKALSSRNSDTATEYIADIYNGTRKVNKISEYAIKGNFALKSDDRINNLRDFIDQYIDILAVTHLKIDLHCNDNDDYQCVFDVSTFGIIIDNVISNAEKARATKLDIFLERKDGCIVIRFRDNGVGLSPTITDPELLFELGATTTNGFGMGLYHIRQLLDESNSAVHINTNIDSGFELVIEVKK